MHPRAFRPRDPATDASGGHPAADIRAPSEEREDRRGHAGPRSGLRRRRPRGARRRACRRNRVGRRLKYAPVLGTRTRRDEIRSLDEFQLPRNGDFSRFQTFGPIVVAIGIVLSPRFAPIALGILMALESGRDKPIAPDLVTAIRDKDSQAVRELIEKGADINTRDSEGNTALILASFYASPQCVALLLEKGAEVNTANKAGVTALIRAATDYEKTRSLVDAGARVQTRTTELGNTPLILAARRAGNSRTVELLLERGANATERNNAGITPIISAGADILIIDDPVKRNNAGITPIISAAASGDLETVRILLAAAQRPMISRNRTIREPPISPRACVHH